MLHRYIFQNINYAVSRRFFCLIVLFRVFVSFTRDFSFVSERLEVLANCDNKPWNGFTRYKEWCKRIFPQPPKISFLGQKKLPPIFALNTQILDGPEWTRKGENTSPCPQWSLRRLWCPSHGQRGVGLCERQQWGCSALGFSCTPQSKGIWVHHQPFVEDCPFMLHFGCYCREAIGQEGQSLTDTELGSLWCLNSSSGAVWQIMRLWHRLAACSAILQLLMNELTNAWYFVGASLLLLPFFEVVLISLLTNKSFEHVFQQHPDHCLIFIHIQSLFLLPLIIRAGCFVLSNTSPHGKCCLAVSKLLMKESIWSVSGMVWSLELSEHGLEATGVFTVLFLTPTCGCAEEIGLHGGLA